MIYSILSEGSLVVFGVIQADYLAYFQMLENIDVARASMSVASLLSRYLIDGTHKSKELTGNDPIQISIFNFLIVFIFFDIKFVVVVPAILHCEF